MPLVRHQAPIEMQCGFLGLMAVGDQAGTEMHQASDGTAVAGLCDLAPANAYVRRQQHKVAERYNLESRSYGKEPNRRVKIYAR